MMRKDNERFDENTSENGPYLRVSMANSGRQLGEYREKVEGRGLFSKLQDEFIHFVQAVVHLHLNIFRVTGFLGGHSGSIVKPQ